MLDRLVLGASSLSQAFVVSLRDRPGTLQVITRDERRAETLVDEGIPTEIGDPADEDAVRRAGPVDVVVVAGSDPATNLAAARAARRVAPGAVLVAYAGTDGAGADRLREVADRVVDPIAATAGFLLDRVTDGRVQKRQLGRVLRGIDRLAIVTHDNPDPDAIASAMALGRLAAARECAFDICYYGDITHHENRAFVNLLEVDLRNVAPGESLEEYDGFALVDHSQPGVNDQLPADLPIDIVIDHHPPRAPVEARFVDLQSDVGATSTLLVEYLEYFNVGLDERVATGLLFGIRVDTDGFTREAVARDFEAAARLLPAADFGTLDRIESPSVSADTFETVASAIRNRRLEGSILLSFVGDLGSRDDLAQAADRLLTLEGTSTTVVYGLQDRTVYVSARSQGTDIDLGEVLRDAFGRIGSAGGHADMAGAQLTLGTFDAIDDQEESVHEIIEAVVTDRFLEALEDHTEQRVTGIYATEYDADEYLVTGEDGPEDGPPTGT